jgi:hypothetical protein
MIFVPINNSPIDSSHTTTREVGYFRNVVVYLIKSHLGFDRPNQRRDLLRKKPAMLRRFIIDIRLDLIPTLSNYGLDSHRWRFLVDFEEPFQAVY